MGLFIAMFDSRRVARTAQRTQRLNVHPGGELLLHGPHVGAQTLSEVGGFPEDG